MKKKILIIFAISVVVLLFFVITLRFFVFPKKYRNYVVEFSKEYNLDSSLVYSIIKVESDFDKNAVSSSGAVGLMQLLPKTAKWIAGELNYDFLSLDLFDEETNIKFGCFYLNYLFKKFDDINMVVCAYNAGEGKVLDWLDENDNFDESKIDYLETKNYLAKVKRFYRVYKNKFVIF